MVVFRLSFVLCLKQTVHSSKLIFFVIITIEFIVVTCFSKMVGSVADASGVLPSSSVRRRQSCYSHYSDVGVLPAVRLMQSGTRPVLGEHNSRMVGSDNVLVRIAAPDPIRTTAVW